MSFFRKLFGIKTEQEKVVIEKEWLEFKENLKNKVSKFTQPAVSLVKTENKTNSKFGGKPIVDNADFNWPKSNGKPLVFLAQFDLKEISAEVSFEWLNNSGSLLFFYDMETMPWGYDPKDKDKWKAIFQKNPSVKIDFPKDLESKNIVKELYIKAHKIDLLPEYDDENIKNLNLSNEDIDLYIEFDEHFEELGYYY